MWRCALAVWLNTVFLVGLVETSGAEMSEWKGPSFVVGADKVLTGDEPEFANCRVAQARYLAGISAKTEAVVYARSPEWGYVMRVLYANIEQPDQKGTLICWRSEYLDETNMIVDVPGTADDLKNSE